jgi:hypothetical protein
MAVSDPIFSQQADGPVAVCTDDIPWRNTGNRVGIKLRDMSFTDRERRFNLRAAVGLTTSEAFSPRHRHTFEQVRYFIDGAAKFGDVVYQPGDCVYFPEAVAYGPQVGIDGTDCLHITLQFAGPSEIYYPTPEEQARSHAELAELGSFAGGKYRWPDGREQDAFEASVEHMTRRPVTYPAPRYDRPIRMRVSAFRGVADARDPRVAIRSLGSFNEIGPDLTFIEAQSGAVLPGGTSEQTVSRFLLEGTARYEGRTLRGLSTFFFPSGRPYEPTVMESPCTFLQVSFGARA